MAGVREKRDEKRLRMLLRRSAREPFVRVGVFGDQAAAKANDSNLTVGQLANAHEFNIPAGRPRSWLRAPLDQNRPRIHRGIVKLSEQVFKGKLTEAQAYAQLGLGIQGMIVQRIADGIPPPLSPSYLRQKLARYPGATTPLIASGQFRGSISYTVEGLPVPKPNKGSGGGRSSKKTTKARRRLQKAIKAIRRGAKKTARATRRAVKQTARAAKRQKRAIARASRGARRAVKRALR